MNKLKYRKSNKTEKNKQVDKLVFLLTWDFSETRKSH